MIALAIHFFLIGVFVLSAIVITDAIEESIARSAIIITDAIEAGIARWCKLGDDK